MQVTETNTDGLKREYKVVVPAGQLATRTEDRLAEIARTVRMPGFRPGKVPMKIVRQKYGPSVVGEVLEQAVNDGAQSAIAERNLRPAAQPKVEITAYAEGADLEFTVALEVLPDIAPMDFASITLEREKAAAPEEEVDDTLARLAERHESSEPVGRAAKEGDIAVIDFVGRQDGIEFPGGSAQDYQLKLGSGTFIPGFEDQLVGKSAGEEVTVSVTFPDAYGNGELAGKPAEFSVTVKEVRAAAPSAVDDELAKKVGLDSLEALKTAIRDEIVRELNALARMKVKRKLLDALAAGHDFPVPGSMVEQEFEAIWKQVAADREQGRIDPTDEGKDEETVKADYRALAERRVRLGLLLADVGRANSVSVTQDDLNKALIEEARRYPGQEHLVFQYYKGNPEALDALRAPIFEDKVIDFILELAQVTDKEVAAADLRTDPDEAEAEAKPAKKAAAKKKAADKAEPADEGEAKPAKKPAAKKKADKGE
ncbi:trigger factor [Magnetospirillum sp. UT-4]|uniref:trigger factor n=1 Tax=Magnetospirillum sp. UT-4 TaxID=2681467 RepID=UPI00137D1B21|nr:trigger factor [Magnetospirillum sp. UT-4]CAA7625791.1 Trigger factor [Magnetospirillum sp. UT-4]